MFVNFHDVVHILSLILSYTLNEKLLNLTIVHQDIDCKKWHSLKQLYTSVFQKDKGR